jgi:hypothetical protein
MEKAEFARKLRTKNRWLVDDSTGIVRTNFTYGGKVVSLEFSKDADGSYRISYPRYNYVSRTSHYTSFEAEARQCMNKSLLFHVIGHLKSVALWDHIANQGFFRVNTENKKISYKEVSRTMRLTLEKKGRVYKEARDPETEASGAAINAKKNKTLVGKALVGKALVGKALVGKALVGKATSKLTPKQVPQFSLFPANPGNKGKQPAAAKPAGKKQAAAVTTKLQRGAGKSNDGYFG